MISFDTPSAVTLALCALLLVSAWWMRRRANGTPTRKEAEDLDTVQDWSPQLVRVMSLPERRAYDILRRALPKHVILSQVPLARFISVPPNNPYSQWLSRVGRQTIDLLVCDRSSKVIVAIEVRAPVLSARSRERHERVADVLAAAGVAVQVWPEISLPTVTEARALLAEAMGGKTGAGFAGSTVPGSLHGELMPLPEMQELLNEGDGLDYHGALEPVASDFFDDLGAIPAASATRH